MRTYYNDNDPKAAAWLRELIREGHIAPGDVDERSIADVRAEDLRDYMQVHLFAGIGGWSYALQLAGWPDDATIWTGSCPCPPFSQAGKKKTCPRCAGYNLMPHPFRTGYFVCCNCQREWNADGRHLWPEFCRLIKGCRPPVVMGEQVASPDGLVWLAGVYATLEALGYDIRPPADLPAAGVAAPQIRQRFWWVADTSTQRRRRTRCTRQTSLSLQESAESRRYCTVSRLGKPNRTRRNPRQQTGQTVGHRRAPLAASSTGRLDDSASKRADQQGATVPKSHGQDDRIPRPAGPWSDFDLVACADGKSRRVEPGTFPLAHGVPGRVGLLRGYGNAIVPELAAKFIEAYLETKTEAQIEEALT